MSKLRKNLKKLADAGWTLRDVIELLETLEDEDSALEDAMLSDDERLEAEISEILKEFRITKELTGHQFLVEAVLMVLHKEFIIHEDMSYLYEKIAIKTKTSDTRKIQSAMRTAINSRWETIKKSKLGAEIFGGLVYNEEAKPTNKCFIKLIAEYIQGKI